MKLDAKLNEKSNAKPNAKPAAKPAGKTASKGSAARAAQSVSPHYLKLVKGYMGFLTGTGKSLATISSYRGDLDLFSAFLRERKKDFYRLSAKDFEAYHYWLEKQGLKTNTRRRKILSAKALVKFAVSRKKLAPSAVQYVKAPERLERLPWIPRREEVQAILAACEPKNALGLRNLLLVTLLSETGLSLAELCALRWEQVQGDAISVEGKRPRRLPLLPETVQRLQGWREKNPGLHLFPGYNRHGVTSEKMSPRGVELFFRALALKTGFRHLKPKTLRHYCVTEWLRQGWAEAEVQKRLGVHPSYSLDPYRKVLEREQPQA
jgi:integrase